MTETRYARSPRFVSRRLDGELLLVPVSAGAADMDSIFILNPVASLIWDSLDGRPLADVVARIEGEFDVAGETAATDAADLLRELIGMNAVQPVPEPHR
jgi:hypothetical protein